MFERLREALDSFLDAATKPDRDAVTRRMHQAVVEAKTSLHAMRDALEVTTHKLGEQRRALEDAERRGRMAAEIGDVETAQIAEEYANKHRERVTVLEQKLLAQEREYQLAEREVDDMRSQLRRARQLGGVDSHVDAAWRTVESVAPGSRSGVSEDDLLKSQMDRASREAAAQARLEELKRKMGR